MSRLSLLFALSIILIAPLFSQGSSVGTATALAVNSSASGSISDASNNHYWKITTAANGYLRFEINSSSSIDVDVTLYDQDGTYGIHSDGRSGTYSEVFGFLKPGTYYVRVYRWSGTTGTYTISNTFTVPSRAADTELNDTPSTALTLSSSGVATGHLGFFGNQSRDTEDYWKITTTEDTWLRVQVRSDSLDLRGDSALDFDVTMYDVNTTSSMTSDGRTGTFSQVAAFLRPGTYYVKVYLWSGRAGSYEIKAEHFPPPLANDAEGNDSWQTATVVSINGSATGHLGYYSNGTTDTEDYWKFTVPSNGKVTVRVVGDSLDRSGTLLDFDLTLYDVNGTASFSSDSRTGPLSECIVYLRPGTFYARVYRWSGNAGSYRVTVTHTPPARANDAEGNDTPATATPLTYNVTSTGHIGYYADQTTDTQDYWRLTAPASDSIYVHVVSDAELDLDITVYASNGTSSISSDGRYGTYSKAGFLAAAGSTYYIRVYRWTGSAGSYAIVAQRSSLVSVEEQPAAQLIPHQLILDQNFPNPFNPSTTIRFGLPASGNIRIAVYSLLGQEIAVLVDEVRQAAYYTVVWEGRGSDGMPVPSGVYLVRLQFGDRQIVRKVMLVR